MVPRNKKITIICEICKNKFQFFVNEESYREYINETQNGGEIYRSQNKSAKELFPHLMSEDIDLIETNICKNCM